MGLRARAQLLISALAACSIAAAQTSGTILGKISDSSGAVVEGAAVTAENLGTGLVQKAETTTDGMYLIPSLPPGMYKIAVESPGFKVFSQSGISLQVGQNARVDATLQVGSVREIVTVAADAIRVDTQSTTIGTTIDRRRLTAIPLNGRNALALAQLLPGVGLVDLQTAVTFARGSGPALNISGSKGGDNNILLDGTTLATAMTNRGLNLPSPDTMEEFRVLTNTFGAEYGRSGGSVITAVTKSGTNELHGSLWEFLRNDALNARNTFAASKPVLRQNQFGGAVGGPIVVPRYNGRNRSFFFGSYQGLRIRQQSLVTFFPPTQQERQGDFSASPRAITDPMTGQPFPGNIIPAGRFDRMAVNILNEYVPLPNQPDGRSLTLRPIPTTGNQYTVKIDHLVSPSHRFSFRYYRNRDEIDNQGGGVAESLAGLGYNNAKSFSLTANQSFRPNLLNEFRASYTRQDGGRYLSQANKTPRQLGGNYNQDAGTPQTPSANVSGRFSIAPNITLVEPDNYRQFDNKISWISGRHHVKAGVLVMRIRHGDNAELWTAGSFTFSGLLTGNPMADYMIGRPASLVHYSRIIDDAVHGEYQLFVQDDFKLNRHLTINMGLRYELNTPWVQRNGNNSAIRAGQQSTKFPTAPPGLVVPGDPGVQPGLYPTDGNNFAPRVGIAWDPTGSGLNVVRAAYGVFYTPSLQNMSALMTNNAPWILPLSFVPPSFSDPYAGREDPFPYSPQNPRFLYPILMSTPSQDIRDAYVQQFNLNIQRQFLADFVVQVGYVGKVGHKFLGFREANAAVYRPGATAANVQERRPFFPQFYDSIGVAFSDYDSNYHSLQVGAEKKFSRGYSLLLAYTYSKSIDNNSTYAVAPSAQDPANYGRGERGLSDFDQKHVFAINGIWEVPFLKQDKRSLIRTLFGGWEIASTTRITSGVPINIINGADFALIGGGRAVSPQRPDVVGSARLDPNRPRSELVARYFDTTAFARPREGQFGNAGRNVLVGPGFSQTDLAVLKRFGLPRERLGRLEFRGEVFNLFNQTNFLNADSTLISPGFGRLLNARDARIVQFGLRYDF